MFIYPIHLHSCDNLHESIIVLRGHFIERQTRLRDKGMTKAIVLQTNYSWPANYLSLIYKLTDGKQRKDFSSYTPT